VPRLSFFYGIAIYLYYEDHPPPHIHARYGEHEAKVDIVTGEVIEGSLPRRAARLVAEWVTEHRDELAACWEKPPAARSPVRSSHCSRSEAMDITHVEVLHDHVVRLRFADGVEKSIDLEPYLHGPVFAEIRHDPAVFASVRVDADAGTIVWPNGADLAPDVLYEGRRSARMESEARAG